MCACVCVCVCGCGCVGGTGGRHACYNDIVLAAKACEEVLTPAASCISLALVAWNALPMLEAAATTKWMVPAVVYCARAFVCGCVHLCVRVPQGSML